MQRAGAVGVALLVALFVGTGVLARASATRPLSRDIRQRYQIDTLVIERGEQGPKLCAGLVMDSYPPQCGGFPVEPFHWSDIDHEEVSYGTKWADVHLVGTFDGRAFHPTARPSPPGARSVPPEPFAPSPCPPPEGGWVIVDHSKVANEDAFAAMAYADSEPDVAAAWFTWPKGSPEGTASYRDAVVNLAFTGDLDRHAREARARWGGPLCVTRLPHTRAQLTRISDDILNRRAQAARAGIHLLGWGPDEPANVVTADVLIADGVAERWFDDRYGRGLVVLRGQLQPIGE